MRVVYLNCERLTINRKKKLRCHMRFNLVVNNPFQYFGDDTYNQVKMHIYNQVRIIDLQTFLALCRVSPALGRHWGGAGGLSHRTYISMGFPDISHHCHFAPLSPEDASPSHLNETSRIIVILHHSHLNETSRIIVISHHSHHLKTIQYTIILYNYSLCRPEVGICIVTKQMVVTCTIVM